MSGKYLVASLAGFFILAPAIAQDVPINPMALITNNALVSTANPLPVTSVAPGTPGPDVTINPTTWVVNGNIVSASNPLPIVLE